MNTYDIVEIQKILVEKVKEKHLANYIIDMVLETEKAEVIDNTKHQFFDENLDRYFRIRRENTERHQREHIDNVTKIAKYNKVIYFLLGVSSANVLIGYFFKI